LIENYAEKMTELKQKIHHILQQLKRNELLAKIFQKPVTNAIAPGYFHPVTRPMDFQTIERRLMRCPDYYKRPEIFYAGRASMAENCKRFNSVETVSCKAAVQFYHSFKTLYQQEFPDASQTEK
jgi:histone acetyltransferase